MNYIFIKTRLAPSPTGLFHIGTARTALINFLFAKQNQGEFLLRMEDTDLQRNLAEYEQDIMAGLKWLGLDWSGEIIYQSKKTERYLEVVDKLQKIGLAYTKDGAVWFKIPENQTIKFNDLIRGEVVFQTEDLKDFVIVRSDKTPIFYLTGVVDDYDSQISHVIRGEEHLSNTPKQILIIQALGWELPTYAHLPLILNPDRSKMSKRKDPVSVTRDFKDQGYLPQALINYLALLGWHEKEIHNSEFIIHNSDTDIYSMKDLIEKFDIKRMQKGGAIFDSQKLADVNNFYLRQLGIEVLADKIINGNFTNLTDKTLIARLVKITQERLKKLSDFAELTQFVSQPLAITPGLIVYKNSSLENAKKVLELVASELDKLPDDFTIQDARELLQNQVGKDGLATGDVFWTIRTTISGQKSSPPPEDLIWALGKHESIKRLTAAISKLT